MKYEYTHKITGEQAVIELVEGDIINMPAKGIQIEIGANDTMRGLRDGQPATDWKPIPEAALKDLANRKMFG